MDLVPLQGKFFPDKLFFCILEKEILAGKNFFAMEFFPLKLFGPKCRLWHFSEIFWFEKLFQCTFRGQPHTTRNHDGRTDKVHIKDFSQKENSLKIIIYFSPNIQTNLWSEKKNHLQSSSFKNHKNVSWIICPENPSLKFMTGLSLCLKYFYYKRKEISRFSPKKKKKTFSLCCLGRVKCNFFCFDQKPLE